MPSATPSNVQSLLAGRRRILVTGRTHFNCCSQAGGRRGAVQQADPDLVLHLADESNVRGTFQLER